VSPKRVELLSAAQQMRHRACACMCACVCVCVRMCAYVCA
jgi:hypothetical protein